MNWDVIFDWFRPIEVDLQNSPHPESQEIPFSRARAIWDNSAIIGIDQRLINPLKYNYRSINFCHFNPNDYVA